MTLEEVEETLMKLQSKPGVLGTLLVTAEGEVLKTSLAPQMLEQVRGEVQAFAQLGGGREQSSTIVGDGSFLRLHTGDLQYISVREGPFLLVAVLGNEGQEGERGGEVDAALGRRFRGRQQLS